MNEKEVRLVAFAAGRFFIILFTLFSSWLTMVLLEDADYLLVRVKRLRWIVVVAQTKDTECR